jgi:ABC-2 type transport system ATP-binding protein
MPESPPARIRVHELTRRYGAVEAVRNVSFEVAPGEIFGLLGLNGAGKTTTIECLLGLRRPDSGSIEIDGDDALAQPDVLRQLVGAQLQSAALPDKITPREALTLFASLHGQSVADVDALLNRFALQAKAGASFDSLSGGQKQRLLLALALVHEPAILVLDEPTAGLDAQARRGLHRCILEQKSAGRTVLLCTHYLEEAQQLCDRIGILHEGQLIATGTPAALIAASQALPTVHFEAEHPLEATAVASLPGVRRQKAIASGWKLFTDDPGRTVSGLVHLLESRGNNILDLSVTRPTLEDVFLELTGRSWPASSGEAAP